MDLQYQNIINQKILPYTVYFLCFSLMLGTAVFSIGMAVFVVLWLISGEYKTKFNAILSNSSIIAPMLLFGLISLGLLYGEPALSERLPIYFKYQKLLYIPLIISVMRTDDQRRNALNAFLVGAIIVMVASYLKIFVSEPYGTHGYIVSRGHIAHDVMMSFAVLLMLRKASRFIDSRRLVWIALALLATLNILFVVPGMTGGLILACLLIFYFLKKFGWKSIGYLSLVGLIFVGAVKFTHIYDGTRLSGMHHEIADPNGSSGIRMVWYKNTLELIKSKPLMGFGTGSFRYTYKSLYKDQKDFHETANPHNQYLLFFSELGFLGVVLFSWMLISQWKFSELLQDENKFLTQGMLIIFSVGCLVNSLLLDAGEGRFFVTLIAVLLSSETLKKLSK